MARIRKKSFRVPNTSVRGRVDGWTFKMDKGWKRYEKAHEVRRFQRLLQKHKKRAFDEIARTIVREVVQASGNFKPNAPLTLLLKSGQKPLVDTKTRLFKAVSTKTISKNKLFIGFSKNSSFYARAKLIHDGGTIRVTQKMRNMFYALWLVSKGRMDPSQLSGRAAELWRLNQEWYPLNESTKAIRIPGRPFMEEVFKDPKVIKKARTEFIRAINRTLKELVR